MFANFTEETCTGTGATLALAGATSGNLAFSESFADGDLVAYVVEDSGGSIKVAGVGTYVSATDDITRNDTWNYNGTSVDKNPSTNITLSGGTHTVRCDVIGELLDGNTEPLSVSGMVINGTNCAAHTNTYGAFQANRIYYMPFYHPYSKSYTTLGTEIVANNGTGNVRVGIYSVGSDGLPDQLIVDSGAISTASTGFVEATVTAFKLEKGYYWSSVLSDLAFDPSAGDPTSNASYKGCSTSSDPSASLAHLSIAQTYGALPDPATTGAFTEIPNRAVITYLK